MKRANKGKGYFYACGQRDKLIYPFLVSAEAADYRKLYNLSDWAANACINGFNGCNND